MKPRAPHNEEVTRSLPGVSLWSDMQVCRVSKAGKIIKVMGFCRCSLRFSAEVVEELLNQSRAEVSQLWQKFEWRVKA